MLPHPTAFIPTKVSAVEILGLTPTAEGAPQPKQGETGDSVSQQLKNTNDSEMKTFTTSYDKLDPVKELEELSLVHVPDSHRVKLREMLREFTPM